MDDRRSFIKLLGATAAGLVMDPEKLLWRPGRKTYSIPSAELTADDLMFYNMKYMGVDIVVDPCAPQFGRNWVYDYYKQMESNMAQMLKGVDLYD